MTIRKLFTIGALSVAAVVFASEAHAQYRPQPMVLPVIKPIRPEPMCVPIYRPINISTTIQTPCIPTPRPAPVPAPRPIPCPRPTKPR
jgi:hypothetical protein